MNNCNQHFNQLLGWNEYCKFANEQAREAYLLWRDNGRRKQGFLFLTMNKSSAYSKYIVRKCKSADSTTVGDD